MEADVGRVWRQMSDESGDSEMSDESGGSEMSGELAGSQNCSLHLHVQDVDLIDAAIHIY